MVTEKKWKILSDIGLDGHTKDGSILDINLIFGKLIFRNLWRCRRMLYIFLMKMIHLYFTNWTFRRLSYSMRVSYTGADPGGGGTRRAPLKLEKIWFFGVKLWFFTRNTPNNFAPPSAGPNFCKCAPTPLTWNPGSARVKRGCMTPLLNILLSSENPVRMVWNKH